jgi:hypothetical protein
LVQIAKLPENEQDQEVKRWTTEADEQPVLIRWFTPPAQDMLERCLETRADLRCAMAALATERYRRANGRWPESLDALVPKYLSKVPDDPFTGKALKVKRLVDGVVIYSVGDDRQDNGGRLDRGSSLTFGNASSIVWVKSASAGSDIGFQLWDVHRRHSPPPIISKSTGNR